MRISVIAEWLVILVLVIIGVWLVFSLATGSGFPLLTIFGKPAEEPSGLPGGLGGLYQEPLPAPMVFTRTMGDWQYTMTAKYRYIIAAKIVGKREYRETGADRIIPIDMSVACGDLIRQENLQYFRFIQGDRTLTYHYEVPEYTGLTESYIDEHISNNHLAFQNETLKNEIKQISVGDCVMIYGYLVDIDGVRTNGDRYILKTSTSRTDEYPAGCEVILVTSFQKVSC